MAALTFFACNALYQLYDLTNIFISSGFSFTRSYRFFLIKRRNYLFREYCRDVWRKYIAEAHLKHSIDAIDGGGEIRVQQKHQRTVQNFNSNRKVHIVLDKIAIDTVNTAAETSAKMWNRGNGIDFAAIEASAEAQETMLRREQAARTQPGFELVEHFDDIEVISGEELNSTFYDYIDTSPVYENKNFSNLIEGTSCTVTGYILLDCERFSINLLLENETRDVALHINPRLPQNYIVRNTKVRDVWGQEEVSSALPFALKRGSKFSVQILVTEACYMISINGHHFAEYNHRLPYQSVNTIEINGDVDNISVERLLVEHYPDRLPESEAKEIKLVTPTTHILKEHRSYIDKDTIEPDGNSIPREFKLIQKQSMVAMMSLAPTPGLSLPYYGRLPEKSLTTGRCLKVEGRVKLLPHSFYINLQRGHNIWPHATIAFHFNPRFSKQSGALDKHIICRNAWFDGSWAVEERSELDADFRPGKTFSLVIHCAARAFEVYVNRKLITTFEHRVKPDIVDTVYIQGDIKLWNVLLESEATMHGTAKIYRNPAYTEDD